MFGIAILFLALTGILVWLLSRPTNQGRDWRGVWHIWVALVLTMPWFATGVVVAGAVF